MGIFISPILQLEIPEACLGKNITVQEKVIWQHAESIVSHAINIQEI